MEKTTPQTMSDKHFKKMTKREPIEENVRADTYELEPNVDNILEETVAVNDFTKASELQNLDDQIREAFK